jgi:hypothetical protein
MVVKSNLSEYRGYKGGRHTTKVSWLMVILPSTQLIMLPYFRTSDHLSISRRFENYFIYQQNIVGTEREFMEHT